MEIRGRRFVLTGRFKRTKREMIRLVVGAGGSINDNVIGSGKNRTDYVVRGEVLHDWWGSSTYGPASDASESVIAKAERNGIPVIGEDELLVALVER
jgi:NAD-dependent DNA ligase